MNLGVQLVTGHDRAVMGEALVGVHDTREIDTGGLVVDERRVGGLRQDDGESRRGDDVCVAGRAGELNIVVEGVLSVNCSGKLADLLSTDGVGALGGIDPAHNLRVNAHAFSLPAPCTAFSPGTQSGRTEWTHRMNLGGTHAQKVHAQYFVALFTF